MTTDTADARPEPTDPPEPTARVAGISGAAEARLRAEAGDPDADAQADHEADPDIVARFNARLLEGGEIAFDYDGATYRVPRYERWPGRAMRALDQGGIWDGIAWAIEKAMGRPDPDERARGVMSDGDRLIDSDIDVLELEALLVAIGEAQGVDPKALRARASS